MTRHSGWHRVLGPPRRCAVVLAGAGARGAYEAGVLSVVLPRLERVGVRPSIFVGTSAGAINAVLFTAFAHLPAEQQAEEVLDAWRAIGPGDVFAPLLRSTPLRVGQWAGERLHVPGVRLGGVLDSTPLRRTAEEVVDWERLGVNLNGGLVSTLAVVATSARTGRAVVFVDEPAGRGPLPPHDSRPIDYVRTRVRAEHVLASAAIPVAFPPVRVSAPEAVSGWYTDGGIRLNAPLKPSFALGADALIVVATHPVDDPPVSPRPAPGHEPPFGVDAAIVQLLDAALVDPMVEDVRTLTKINELVAGGAQRSHDGRRPFQVMPFLFFGPQERGSLAEEASRAYHERFGGLGGAARRLRHPDLPLLAGLFGGTGPRGGDLLSYILFDRAFVDRAVDLGRRDAARLLASAQETVPDRIPWRIGR